MKRILIILFLLLLVSIVIAFALQKPKSLITNDNYPLLGISGYVPNNFPKSNLFDIAGYWKNIKNEAQIYGIHANWNEVNTINSLSKNSNLPVELVLGFQDPSDISKKEEVKKNIDEILTKNKNIKYLGIGNEINIIFDKYPKSKSEYISTIIEISKYVKSKYPSVKTFTSFQYDALRGKAKLMGIKDRKVSFNDVLALEKEFDLLAFTAYPFLEYGDVKSIPKEYLEELNSLNIKRIGITETSWPTQSKISLLKDLKYSFNESMQAEYLVFLKERVSKISNLEFMNIAFMNDIVNWENDGNSKNPLFDSVGLKKNNGKTKLGYSTWIEWISE
jgi:hypothetical protein